jgi:drug/metabolite transporter (DMT)-like permease
VLEIVLLFLIIVGGTAGELCVSRAMKTLGETTDFRPSSLVRFVFRAMRVPWLWAGISLMGVAFFCLLAMLSIQEVTFVVPVTALSYVAGAVGATTFLGERISHQRWLGLALVCVGVTVVWLSKH